MAATQNPVSGFFNLIKLERKELLDIYLYAILGGLIQLSLPLGVQAIIGYVLGASMRASLVVLIALVVTGVLISGLMQVNQMKLIEKIQQKIFVRYAMAYTNHIPRLDLKQTDNIYLPELANRFFDVPVLQKGLSKILLDIPTASIQILFGLILLSFYHPAFIIFGMLLIILLWFIMRYTGQHGLQTSYEESSHKYRVASLLEETARIFKSVKIAKSNVFHIHKTDTNVVQYLKARNKHFKILLVQYNVLVMFKVLITAAMLIVGTVLLVNQQLNIGQFIAAEIIILLIINSVEKLIMNLGTAYDTVTSVNKIARFTNTPTEPDGTRPLTDTGKGLQVELKDLGFSFDNKNEVLNNISLKINAGEKVCLRGADSSGKSTLMRLLSGAFTDFSGSYLLDGLPLGNYQLDTVRSRIGLLNNQQDIFHGSLLENITLGNPACRMEDIVALSNIVGLSSFINSLKDGFNTPLDPTGKRLPRNVINKILLVRVLAGNPRLLLLEEPFQHLEPANRQQVIDYLLQLQQTTVIVVSNNPDFFEMHCSRVLTISQGSLV